MTSKAHYHIHISGRLETAPRQNVDLLKAMFIWHYSLSPPDEGIMCCNVYVFLVVYISCLMHLPCSNPFC